MLELEGSVLAEELQRSRASLEAAPHSTDFLCMPVGFYAQPRTTATTSTTTRPHFAAIAMEQQGEIYGLRGDRPPDRFTEAYLSTPKGMKDWKGYFKERPPLVALLSFPASGKGAKELHDLMMWTIREQTRYNRKWLLLGLKDRPGWTDSRLHAEMRAAGAQTAAVKRKGQEASKLQAASNCELLRQAAQLPEKRPEAEPGSDSFSHSLLCCLRDLVRGYKPTRFEEKRLRKRRSKACGEWDHNPTTGYVNESFYVDAVRDPNFWRSVMEQVESLFRTSATRQVTLSEGHEV